MPPTLPLIIFCPRELTGGSQNYWQNLVAEQGFLDCFSPTVVAQAGRSTEAAKVKLQRLVTDFIEYPADRAPRILHRVLRRLVSASVCKRTIALKKSLEAGDERSIVWFILDCFSAIGYCAGPIEHCIATSTPYHLIVQHAPEFAHFADREETETAKRLFLAARRVVFVSRRNLATAELCLGSKLANSFLGVNGLTKASFDKAHRLGRENPPRTSGLVNIINVARFDVSHKRQDLLLQALAKVNERSSLARCTFVGGGSDLWFLENTARFLGLHSPEIRFLDRIDDPTYAMVENDVFALTSAREGMAFALVEAAAACRPLIATNVAGAPELVIEGITGYLAESATTEAVATALMRAIADRSNWVKRGQAAHEFARANYCLADVVQRLHKINAIDLLT